MGTFFVEMGIIFAEMALKFAEVYIRRSGIRLRHIRRSGIRRTEADPLLTRRQSQQSTTQISKITKTQRCGDIYHS